MHSSLRSLNFWRVMLINVLVSTMVYMSLPLWPALVVDQDHVLTSLQTGQSLLLFAFGMLVPGCVSSYLLDAYRRKMACFWTVVVLAGTCLMLPLPLPFWSVLCVRCVQGMAFSLFHIALGNTILVDITVSERRDFASYIYFWICKLSLGLGPLLGVLLISSLSVLSPSLSHYVRWLPLVFAVLAIYFNIRLQVPFRAPLRTSVFSLDRFWLPHCIPLALLLLASSFPVGVHMACNTHPLFFVFLLAGFVASLLFHFTVFYRADIRAEIVTGYLAIVAAFLLLVTDDNGDVPLFAAALNGYGLGNVSGRVLSFFTRVSNHTERGSAQGTYKLTFEVSMCLGFALPCVLDISVTMFNVVSLLLAAIGLAFYLLYVNSWYKQHVKR